MAWNFVDETGNRYSKLVVLSRAENDITGCAQWLCLCDCGNESVVRGSLLRDGHTKSCGCIQKDKTAQRNMARRKHASDRDRRLLSKYGISSDEYDAMCEDQNNLCAICKKSALDQGCRLLAVDHCHDTGIVRGLLCVKCNIGLGHFNDDIDLMKSAIKYLEGV
jgi:hypothetical protein